jgi:hypothetical protein
MSSWDVVVLPTVDDDGQDWITALETQDFYLWDVQAERTVAGDGMYWGLVAGPVASDAREWCAPVPETTAPRATFLGLTEAPEDYLVFPSDVELEPEFVQADQDQWYLLPGPS